MDSGDVSFSTDVFLDLAEKSTLEASAVRDASANEVTVAENRWGGRGGRREYVWNSHLLGLPFYEERETRLRALARVGAGGARGYTTRS